MNYSQNEINEHFHTYDWYHDAGVDSSGRIVIYVNRMSQDIEKAIPTSMFGKQVLVHFAASKLASKDKFTESLVKLPPEEKYEELDESDIIVDADLSYLTDELDRLEKLCNSNILQDIFYEVHDGKNAVTNLSGRYPEVRESMEKLYSNFGFDVIYEEMDG